MKHILEADSIQFEIKGRKLLSDIYLKCETGKITGLLGRNGQGKSCLMNIVYGTLGTEKSVRIDNVAKYKAFKEPLLIRYAPQFNFIPGFLSVNEVLSQFNIDGSDLVALFPDGELSLKTRLKNLSGGFRRLVEIYVIIMSPSYFVLLDEPFTHLSPVQIEKIKELIIKEKSSKGFLITDHMYHHVLDVSDSLYVLTDAKTYLTKSVLDIEALGYAKTV